VEIALITGAFGFAVLATALSVHAAWRSQPAEILKRLDSTSENVEKMFHEWASARLHFEKMREELLDLAESVETKRRRTAASASKQQKRETEAESLDPNSPAYREALLQRARAQGHPV
jgi:hypothetical protein